MGNCLIIVHFYYGCRTAVTGNARVGAASSIGTIID
jgi:hypothetical protein